MAEFLTAKDLAVELGTSADQINIWIKEGMPHEIKRHKQFFDLKACRRWWIENGYCEIAKTRSEAALSLGVGVRAIASWLNEPTFPGRSGTPGNRDGNFPIAEIQEWRLVRFADTTENSEESKARIDLLKSRARLLEIEVEKKESCLIDAKELSDWLQKIYDGSLEIFARVPDKVLSAMPKKIKGKDSKRIKKEAERVRDEVCDAMHELIEGDRDLADEY